TDRQTSGLLQASVHVLRHSTAISPGFQCTVHVGNVRQTAIIEDALPPPFRAPGRSRKGELFVPGPPKGPTERGGDLLDPQRIIHRDGALKSAENRDREKGPNKRPIHPTL
ncbi:hypothetical protein ACJJTC_015267, partial [Scirpophaga incertulas]